MKDTKIKKKDQYKNATRQMQSLKNELVLGAPSSFYEVHGLL
jgi:hypothetical protein